MLCSPIDNEADIKTRASHVGGNDIFLTDIQPLLHGADRFVYFQCGIWGLGLDGVIGLG